MKRVFRTSLLRKALFAILLASSGGGIVYAKNAKPKKWHQKSLEELKNAKGFTWITKSTPHYDLFVDSGTLAEREIGQLEREMEDSLPGLQKLLGGPLKARLQAFVVSSEPRMNKLMGGGGLSTGFAWGTIITMVYQQDLRDMGIHETCHNMARFLWGNSHAAWVNEGLAVYSENNWRGVPLHQLAKWLLDRHKIIPLNDVIAEGLHQKFNDMVTYPELGSFLKFVYETYGLDSVKVLWRRGAKGARKAFGKPLDAVEQEWLAALSQIDATSVHYHYRGMSSGSRE